MAAGVRNRIVASCACGSAALDGYERAQIAGLCQEDALECAVDAIRMLDLNEIFPKAALDDGFQAPPRGPFFA